jgi:OmcA/MtrC family decaheme c-type cytochrome
MISSIVSVSDLLPGQKPTVVFTLSDRNGTLTPINDAATPPTPANDAAPKPSPVPRKVTRLAFVLSGPTSPDYATGNAPQTETVTATLVADGSGQFTYTFQTVALPATATGAWSVALESRRQLTPASPFYDPATDTFSWPYTGEALTEFANNALANVDVATGTSAGPPALARRTVVSQQKCEVCHKKLLLHGGNRSTIPECLMCHAPETTDWNRRPKVAAGGNVLLAGTLDGIEERSINFKTMIHRIHTGARSGLAQLDAEPFVIYGFGGVPIFFDEGVFPNDLTDCRLCHEGESFLPESIPGGALGTVANETATVRHATTAAHGASEVSVLPIAGACTSCHDTGTAKFHAAKHTVGNVEGCVACHGASGSMSTYVIHGLAAP